MEDVAPALLEQIRQEFLSLLGDAELASLTYPGAADYAERVGDALATAFDHNLSSEVLPDGKMYWNIADSVVRPMLEQDHELVSNAAVQAQQALNIAAGIGLIAQRASLNSDRVNGILNRLSAAEQYDDVAWILDEPVRTFSRSVVDDTLQQNVDFQGKAGLSPKIIRRAESKCCEWCSRLEGEYTYPNVPDDIYRRHEHCRCVVEYDPGTGKRQNVHTEQWTEPKEELENRKNLDGIVTPSGIREETPFASQPENVLTEYMRTATPGSGTITYDQGYKKSKHKAEIKTAQWLHENFGGDIVLLQENLSVGKSPDFIWREKYWELKSISSAKAADNAVRWSVKQIDANPGGIIIDCEQNEISITNLQRIISARMKRSGKSSIDVIISANDNVTKILRYKK